MQQKVAENIEKIAKFNRQKISIEQIDMLRIRLAYI